MRVIHEIVKRARDEGLLERLAADFVGFHMDVSAAHLDIPLQLDQLLHADEYTFAHDVIGIHHHINRETGKIERFVPRTAQPSEAQ